MSEQLCRAILKESGKKIASNPEMETLREAQRQYNIANDGLTTYNRQNADADWIKHKADLVKAVEAGNIGELHAWTREKFEADYAIKSGALYERMRQITQSILPMAVSIMEKFCTLAEENAKDALAAEIKEHEKFGVIHRPSGLVIAFGKAAEFARARCPKNPATNYSPKVLLPYLDL